MDGERLKVWFEKNGFVNDDEKEIDISAISRHRIKLHAYVYCIDCLMVYVSYVTFCSSILTT